MKQIKYLMLAMMAFVASTTFTACSSDDDNNAPGSNYDRYQQAVNQTVNTQKKSNKVILLVAFGSTWEQVLVRMLILRTTTIQSTGSPLSVWLAISRSWFSRCR